jgi:hypothetical protein
MAGGRCKERTGCLAGSLFALVYIVEDLRFEPVSAKVRIGLCKQATPIFGNGLVWPETKLKLGPDSLDYMSVETANTPGRVRKRRKCRAYLLCVRKYFIELNQ